MSANHVPVAYTVWLDHGLVKISPPVLSDYQSLGGHTENTIVLTSTHGVVLDVRTRNDVASAIYDFSMSHMNIGNGDTFKLRGDTQPYLIIRDGEVERC